MKNESSKILELSDFAGKGRFLNLSNFKEVEEIQKAKVENLSKSKKTDIEKGELDEALGYGFSQNNKFEKKGSEIEEKVKLLVTKVEAKKSQCLTDMNKIAEDLGVAPTRSLDEWETRGLSEEVAKSLKKYPWEQCCFDGNKQTSSCDISTNSDMTSVKTAGSKEEADSCRGYNKIVECFIDCVRDLDKAATFLANVDAKKSYQLSLSELKALGF